MSGFVVWFTGLSGAGKSTLGALLAAELRFRGEHVEVLDGDEVRTHLSKGLGFSREDRDTNVRRIGFVAKLVARSGAVAITAAISPFRSIRDEQRAAIGRFVEVYCCSTIEALAARDAKGLYRKALAGEIKGFTGIDDPYEAPESPEVTVFTDRETKEESLAKILSKLEELGYVRSSATTLGKNKTALVPPHGGELVLRTARGDRRDNLVERARTLPVLDLDGRAEMDLDLFASGAFSPLKGFVGSKDWLRVAREMRLENGLPWPLPITLEISEETLPLIRKGEEAALRTRDGRIVGIIEIDDIFRPNDLLRGERVLGPLGEEDPAMQTHLSRNPLLVGGEVWVLEAPVTSVGQLVLSPAETRTRLSTFGLENIAFLRTSSLPTAAAEHLGRLALEHTAGLVLQVLASHEETNAVPFAARLRGYRALAGSYFPTERVLVTGGIETRESSGRRVVLDAILAQNHGASRIVIVGSSCPGGVADAERAFRVYAPGELWALPLCFEDAFYSTRAGCMVSTRSAPSLAEPTQASQTEALRPEVLRALEADPSRD